MVSTDFEMKDRISKLAMHTTPNQHYSPARFQSSATYSSCVTAALELGKLKRDENIFPTFEKNNIWLKWSKQSLNKKGS